MNIAIAGLGTVGAEVARQLIHHSTTITSRAGTPLKVTAVSARTPDRDRGFAMDGIAFEADPVALATRDDVDLVVELIGGDDGPALALIEAALNAGKSVVTANKALLAKHGARLAAMAEAHDLHLMGEASVAGGIPSLKMLREGLAGNRISRISGILNGTCNYILSTMETTGRGFDDVLAEAQELGYAEADPSFDVDGIDAAHKLALLGAIGFGTTPDFDGIAISGIRSVSAVDISFAEQMGYAIRLLAIVEKRDDQVMSTVRPTLVPLGSGLANVDGPLNAVEVHGEPLGSVIAMGPGAGAGATASAVLADMIDIAAGRAAFFFGSPAQDLTPPAKATADHAASYYLRLTVVDRPGVLAEITTLLSAHDASVDSMLQQGVQPGSQQGSQQTPQQRQDGDDGETVEIVLTTHDVNAAAMARAIDAITGLEAVTEPPTAMVIAASS